MLHGINRASNAIEGEVNYERCADCVDDLRSCRIVEQDSRVSGVNSFALGVDESGQVENWTPGAAVILPLLLPFVSDQRVLVDVHRLSTRSQRNLLAGQSKRACRLLD